MPFTCCTACRHNPFNSYRIHPCLSSLGQLTMVWRQWLIDPGSKELMGKLYQPCFPPNTQIKPNCFCRHGYKWRVHCLILWEEGWGKFLHADQPPHILITNTDNLAPPNTSPYDRVPGRILASVFFPQKRLPWWSEGKITHYHPTVSLYRHATESHITLCTDRAQGRKDSYDYVGPPLYSVARSVLFFKLRNICGLCCLCSWAIDVPVSNQE